MTSPQKPQKADGLKHLFLATRYSAQGLARMVQEPAFRHEVALYVVIMIALIWAGAPALNLVLATGLFAVMAAVETLNTAIEETVDKLSPGYSEYARVTKDLGSFAVMLMIGANLLHAAYALWITLF